MFKWLVKLVVKPLIAPIKKALGLCDKLTTQVEKISVYVNNLPLEAGYKNEILKTLSQTKDVLATIKSVLVAVLDAAGVDSTVVVDSESISKTIESIKSLI